MSTLKHKSSVTLLAYPVNGPATILYATPCVILNVQTLPVFPIVHYRIRCTPNTLVADQCPQCETLCDPLPSPCNILCEAPNCTWTCVKPTDCPQPRCELHCESPTCSSSSGSRMSALFSLFLILFLVI